MKISDIPQVASWLSEAGIATYELTGPDYRICLRRSVKARSRRGLSAGSGKDSAGPARSHSDSVVASPGVGVFLRAHPVQEAALVEPNDPVAAGQPLGLLQVGPILLPVLCPRDGVVASIIAPERSLVGYGDPLVALMS
jgi:acetyl-CoA carboxylase biotin carboxyl carrier protein